MKKKCCRVFVSGRVQGVGFRAFVARQASRYSSLRGYVRNLSDGRVEALFLGDEASVEAMIVWCRKGPSMSKVTQCETVEEGPIRILEMESLDSIFEVEPSSN